MKSDTTNKKHNKILSIVIFIILVVAIVLIVGYAYAKYVTSQSGEAQAEIAEWNVAISINDNTNENVEVDLANTRNKEKEEADVQDGYVAPGTAGKFNIEVNAENSDVSLEYEINMNVDYGNNEKFPKNLVFYSDENMENAFYHTDNTIELNGFIGYNDSKKTATIPIYWKWAYETGTTDMEKEKNDELDSYWLGKTIEPLTLKVVAKQVNTNQDENPMANQYAVTLDTNGGTLEGYGDSGKVIKQVSYGGQYGELPEPTREGYTFKGWQTAENLISTDVSDWEQGAINTNNGQLVENNHRIRLKEYLKISPNTNYEISVQNSNNIKIRVLCIYDKNKVFVNSEDPGTAMSSQKFTTKENASFMKISLRYHDGDDNKNISVEAIEQANLKLIANVKESTLVTINKNHTLTAIWEKN